MSTFKFFDEAMVQKVIERSTAEMGAKLTHIRACLDALEPGLGATIYQQVIEEWQRGDIDALQVPHRMSDELERHRRGAC